MNQPQQAQLPPGTVRLLRPEQMRNISYLSQEEKTKYEEGLKTLWAKVNNNPADSQEHIAAKQKIGDFSRMVMNKIRNIQSRAQGAQGQLPTAGVQPQPPQSQPQTSHAAGAPATPTVAAKPTMQANRPQTLPGGPNNANAGSSAGNAAAGGMPKHIMEHTKSLPWANFPIPAHFVPEQGQKWLEEMKNKYLQCLVRMEQCKARATRLDAMIKARQDKGPLPPDEAKRIQEQRNTDKKAYTEAESFVRSVRQQMMAQGGNQQGVASGQSNGQPARPQSMQASSSGNGAPSNPMQAATASVNAAMDAAKNQQLAAATAAANRTPGPGQQQPQSQPPQQPQTPATPATPSVNAHSQQPQVKMEPGSNMHHPPPVNTALAAASSANMPSAGTPTQASARVQTPQSTQQAPGSQVRPLTHAAAVNRANSSTNVTGVAPAPGGVTTTPGSGGLMGNASQPGHSHAHPQPAATMTAKMPIPKNLPEAATKIPQPVTLGGGNSVGRPTLGGGTPQGGVMTQPVIPKIQIPQFDTEGDHILSKKKLDELVRQVCGGASPGAEGNYLTPDVEESVLNVADNFVDNVLHTACKLAKERGSKVLEIRDMQLVMERVYNIRIPGYTSDELRTVRKVQPAPQWIAKMSAIQAAKVTSSKDDK